MTTEQYLKNLNPPISSVDIVLDTDAYNEIDDQFAISYMLRSQDRLHVKGICAAPFLNSKSTSAADGMEKSYQEILKLLDLADAQDLKANVYRGSDRFMIDENTPVLSDSAAFLSELANEYSPEHPLYIVAIGAITNVASALLLNPAMKENTVIVWLGGNGVHLDHNREFNLYQDIAAARIVFGCGVPLVQLPCGGVVDHFATSRYELEHWLLGKNKLCDYLVENTIAEAESYAKGRPWTRVIWDVTAVAWLLNVERQFMTDCLIHSPIPEYDDHYGFDNRRHFIKYVNSIKRDALFADLFEKLSR